jgi:phosphate transport system substrate-binding protein
MSLLAKSKLKSLTGCLSLVALTVGFNQALIQPSLAVPTPINGSGSSFAQGLYQGTSPTGLFSTGGSWFSTYAGLPSPTYPDVIFNYAAVGSGTGVTSFLTQTPPSGSPTVPAPIAFGATDDPITSNPSVGTPNQGPTVQVPIVGGGIVLIYNKTGLTVPANGIKLSRRTYCGIFNGTINNWNAPEITSDNGGAVIAASLPIKVVRRPQATVESGSGTTFNLTKHLHTVCRPTPLVNPTPAISPAVTFTWNRGFSAVSRPSPACTTPVATPAAGSAFVCWPSTFLQPTTKGGSALTSLVNSTNGGFGYVDIATFVSQANSSTSKLKSACLQNQGGAYICPPLAKSVFTAVTAANLSAFATSVSNSFIGATDTDPDANRIALSVPNPSSAAAYPIASATYLLFYKTYANALVAAGIRGPLPSKTNGFIDWATSSAGDTIARNRGYAPLPSTIKTQVNTLVNTILP